MTKVEKSDKESFILNMNNTEKMVFCYQNCSSDREKLLKFEAESRELSKFLRSLEQFIQTVRSEQFLVTECFF